MKEPQSLDDIFREEEERAARYASSEEGMAEQAALDARMAVKREAERKRHIALGWVNEDGSPISQESEEDEEDEEE